MLISQAVVWMPVVHCDACGTEVSTRDAIPHINLDCRHTGGKQYQLHFFCSKTCEVLGKDLSVIEPIYVSISKN
jgi:hypothetical protein